MSSCPQYIYSEQYIALYALSKRITLKTIKMQITVRTLKNEKYPFEVDGTLSVAEFKGKVHEKHSLGAPETQKLIYNGKILKDDQTLDDSGVKDGGFIVLMIRKVKASPKPVQANPAPEAVPAPSAVPSQAHSEVEHEAPAPFDYQASATSLVRVCSYVSPHQ